MKARRKMVLLRVAAVLALVALALIVWSILDPHPFAVIVAMSVGQAIGTLSLLVYLFVVAQSVGSSAMASEPPPPPSKP